MTQKEFFNKYSSYAVKAGKKLGVNPSYIYAQWAHETGYGNSPATKNNNLAGINITSNSAKGSVYNTLDDFVNSYVRVIKQDRYKGYDKAKSASEFAHILQKGGYATDSNYGNQSTWKIASGYFDSNFKIKLSDFDPIGKVTEKGVENWVDETVDSVVDETAETLKGVAENLVKLLIYLAIGILIIISLIMVFLPKDTQEIVFNSAKGGLKNIAKGKNKNIKPKSKGSESK
jgi:hypothetical protein